MSNAASAIRVCSSFFRSERAHIPSSQTRLDPFIPSQLSAPTDTHDRSIYTFACRRASCLQQVVTAPSSAAKAFRFEQPLDQGPSAGSVHVLCHQCNLGQPGTSAACACSASTNVLWKEWSLDSFGESEVADDEPTNPPKLEPGLSTSADPDATAEDTITSVDTTFLAFQDRIRPDPDQVLRYYRRGNRTVAGPLWVSDARQAEPTDIPACSGCGSSRSCEFQVCRYSILMPSEVYSDLRERACRYCLNSSLPWELTSAWQTLSTLAR